MSMFKQHGLRLFEADFKPVHESESSMPSLEFMQHRIAQSLADDNILRNLLELGGDKPVHVTEVKITVAAFHQIRDMWWSVRDRSAYESAPKIPLKYFTFRISRKDEQEGVSVEIYPGLDDWEPQ